MAVLTGVRHKRCNYEQGFLSRVFGEWLQIIFVFAEWPEPMKLIASERKLREKLRRVTGVYGFDAEGVY